MGGGKYFPPIFTGMEPRALKSELGQFSPSGANLPNGFMKFVFPHVGMDIKAASNAF